MTVKELFEGVLIEVKQENFPQLHLREFNYYANEAVSEFIDDIYLAFEANQKSLDYLKGIKRTTDFDLTSFNPGSYPNSLKFTLPSDYRHLTGLTVFYEVLAPITDECYEVGDVFDKGSKPLNSDTYVSIVSDPFQRPRYFRPYHMIVGNECFVLNGQPAVSDPSDPHELKTVKVLMDYLKTPEILVLTYQQAFQDTDDNSQVMEFDNISNKKIRDKIIQKLLERNKDQRTSTHTQINQVQPQADVMTNTRP